MARAELRPSVHLAADARAAIRPRARKARSRFSLGTKVILTYVTFSLLIPAIMIALTGFQSLIYRQPPFTFGTIFYGLMMGGALVVACLRRVPEQQARVRIYPPPFLLSLGIIGGMLYATSLGYSEGLSRWRYSGEGLSESLSPVAILYVLAPYLFEFFIFLQIFVFRPDTAAERWQQRLITLLLVVGLGLTASGIGPMLTVLVVALYLLFPAQFQLLVFQEKDADENKRVAAKIGLIPMAAIGGILMLIALVVGEQIKTGADQGFVTQRFSVLTLREWTNYIVERFSTAWISLQVALSNYLTVSWSEVGQNLWAPIGNLLFRLDFILGSPFGVDRPYAGSLARVNYEAINYYPVRAREGTSPGLLASFVMAFPIPVSIIAMCGYIVLVRNLLTTLARGMAGTPTVWGGILVLYFTFALFATPLDFFLLLDPGFLVFVCYGSAALFIARKSRSGT